MYFINFEALRRPLTLSNIRTYTISPLLKLLGKLPEPIRIDSLCESPEGFYRCRNRSRGHLHD